MELTAEKVHEYLLLADATEQYHPEAAKAIRELLVGQSLEVGKVLMVDFAYNHSGSTHIIVDEMSWWNRRQQFETVSNVRIPHTVPERHFELTGRLWETASYT